MAQDARNIRTPVYLDHHATTPVDPRVLEKMLPWFTEKFGNPHSSSHAFGREAAETVEHARSQVAELIGAEAREIVFTSGATESNNLAIKGAALFEKRHRGKRTRVVTVATEHKCVIESVRALEDEGFETVFLPVGPDGLVDMDRLDAAVDDSTLLVSVMAANNEIGVLQPIAEIGALARARGALFHTDAAQAAGKVPLDVEADTIDLMSISGHKLYGPKGIGVLYVRRRPRARIEPLFSGGGQERTLRSGTLAPPLVVGIGRRGDGRGGRAPAPAARPADARPGAACGRRLAQRRCRASPAGQSQRRF
jgi:cysteine desulfurase